MDRSTVYHHRFENGLGLVAERISGMQSAAFSVLLPAGAANDPPEGGGSAVLLSDLMFRGAGQRDSRQLVAFLDDLGLQRSEGVDTEYTILSGALLGENLPEALAVYGDVLRRPRLPDAELPAVKALATQHLAALEDDPLRKMFVELMARWYPYPMGRCTLGDAEQIHRVSHGELAGDFHKRYQPNGTIIGVAGRIEWERLRDQVGELFADWPAAEPCALPAGEAGPKLDHISQEIAQTQIGIAYRSVPYRDPEYFLARAAVGVLSGGMSGRLFTEVREKRSLCYAVHASLHSLKDRGSVLCYAGTTTERAQQTLDVTLGELRRLTQGVEDDELERVKTGLKSAVIMQQESSMSRSAAIVRDWYHLGRVRSLEELHELIDGLAADAVTAHLARVPPEDFTILTLGSASLEVA